MMLYLIIKHKDITQDHFLHTPVHAIKHAMFGPSVKIFVEVELIKITPYP